MLATKIVVLSAIGKKLAEGAATRLSAILDFRLWGLNYWSRVFRDATIRFLMLENHTIDVKMFALSAIGKKLAKMAAILDFRLWGLNYWSGVFRDASIRFLMLENHMIDVNIFDLSAIGKKLAENGRHLGFWALEAKC